MLTIFRRHTKDCIARHDGRDPGRTYRRCQCPLHAEGHLGGMMHRKGSIPPRGHALRIWCAKKKLVEPGTTQPRNSR